MSDFNHFMIISFYSKYMSHVTETFLLTINMSRKFRAIVYKKLKQ